MAKFKKGDRVINLQDNGYVDAGVFGVVLKHHEGDISVLVKWDNVKEKYLGDFNWWQDTDKLKLIKEPKTQTIEIYKIRGEFKFRVKGANGKTLNHLFNSKQGCKKGIEALAKAMSNYKIVDLTKKS